jgi:adenylosuccinate synthase
MPVTIVVGGQYGSEGKGKVVSLLAREMEAPFVVRCGGPNSGHTVDLDTDTIVLRQVPSCPEHPDATLVIAAGCAIDEQILIEELDHLRIAPDRIIVDPRAVLVSEEDRTCERDKLQHVSSTCSGTGSSLVRRMSREHGVKLAKDSGVLAKRSTVRVAADVLHDEVRKGGDVLVEGTQGFGLSLLHGADYPYVTSRDTTASAFAMEAGLAPHHVDNVIMVIRTFPIRVGGHSGPLANEISWEEIQRMSGAPEPYPEYTSVTRKLRRVAMFDIEAVKRACRYNAPTGLALMGLDRLDFANRGVSDFGDLTAAATDFISFVETHTRVPTKFVGTGFRSSEAIRLSIEVQSGRHVYV